MRRFIGTSLSGPRNADFGARISALEKRDVETSQELSKAIRAFPPDPAQQINFAPKNDFGDRSETTLSRFPARFFGIKGQLKHSGRLEVRGSDFSKSFYTLPH